ncbi:MAG: hypoxanthine phosphoribosyltransferase [Ignavibacteria bacterium]|jgi:hypoxanthine phosphoribosyltransferase|nr:hypoxanthine phosphoribosyltransferase [Ignavibacteria bacterium]MDH7527041.1 hypoxanthine phosphoribosyltransferase [Ignavibacteria bacterium]
MISKFNAKEIQVNGETFEILIDENAIQKRVAELGEEISRDYEGKIPIFIGVLNGSVIFFADLIRNISINCEVDFLKLSSYGDAKISSGNVKLIKELNADIKNRDIIIVEDIVDTGLSIVYMKGLLQSQNPASIKVVTLLHKPDATKYDIKLDYIGFKIPNKFVIGYGLDHTQKYRNLRSIYALKN